MVMASDSRMIAPLTLSAAAHASVLALLFLGARFSWPAPPIPIEVRTAHRTVQRTSTVERRGDPRTQPHPRTRPSAHTNGTKIPKSPPPPETTDLAPFAPDDAHLVILLRMDKLRQSPHRQGVEALLSALPDWSTLVTGSNVSPLDDFEALLIATANPRDVTATFLAARHADVPKVRALVERTLPSGDPRQFRTLKPGLTVLAQPSEWDARDPKNQEARAQWIDQLEKFDEVARAPNGPAVLVTLSDAPALVHFGGGIPTPQALALATTAEASPSLRVRIVFATKDEADAFARQWPAIVGRYRALTALLGLGAALDGIALQTKENEVELMGRVPEAQVRLAIHWIVPLLPHPPPPQ
jgi:hypothetical protein